VAEVLADATGRMTRYLQRRGLLEEHEEGVGGVVVLAPSDSSSDGELGRLAESAAGRDGLDDELPFLPQDAVYPVARLLCLRGGSTAKSWSYSFLKYRASFARKPARAVATGDDSRPTVDTVLKSTMWDTT